MTNEEFRQHLTDFWAEIEAPGGVEGVSLLLEAAGRMAEQVGMPPEEFVGAFMATLRRLMREQGERV